FCQLASTKFTPLLETITTKKAPGFPVPFYLLCLICNFGDFLEHGLLMSGRRLRIKNRVQTDKGYIILILISLLPKMALPVLF
ncbi:MAG TPA: hypothetical protein PLG48_02240, partial [Candidatus Avimonas sp.]|nr:hypothetical protein [Candidatus Avimonas sp.]